MQFTFAELIPLLLSHNAVPIRLYKSICGRHLSGHFGGALQISYHRFLLQHLFIITRYRIPYYRPSQTLLMANATTIALSIAQKPIFHTSNRSSQSAETASKLLQQNHERHHIFFNDDEFHVRDIPFTSLSKLIVYRITSYTTSVRRLH